MTTSPRRLSDLLNAYYEVPIGETLPQVDSSVPSAPLPTETVEARTLRLSRRASALKFNQREIREQTYREVSEILARQVSEIARWASKSGRLGAAGAAAAAKTRKGQTFSENDLEALAHLAAELEVVGLASQLADMRTRIVDILRARGGGLNGESKFPGFLTFRESQSLKRLADSVKPVLDYTVKFAGSECLSRLKQHPPTDVSDLTRSCLTLLGAEEIPEIHEACRSAIVSHVMRKLFCTESDSSFYLRCLELREWQGAVVVPGRRQLDGVLEGPNTTFVVAAETQGIRRLLEISPVPDNLEDFRDGAACLEEERDSPSLSSEALDEFWYTASRAIVLEWLLVKPLSGLKDKCSTTVHMDHGKHQQILEQSAVLLPADAVAALQELVKSWPNRFTFEISRQALVGYLEEAAESACEFGEQYPEAIPSMKGVLTALQRSSRQLFILAAAMHGKAIEELMFEDCAIRQALERLAEFAKKSVG